MLVADETLERDQHCKQSERHRQHCSHFRYGSPATYQMAPTPKTTKPIVTKKATYVRLLQVR